MPEFSKTHAQQVILEIIRQAGGAMLGRTKLFHAFYCAHLFYAEDNPGILTDWPIVRMANGPGIGGWPQLLKELSAAGLLQYDTVQEGPYKPLRFRVMSKDIVADPLPEDARAAIQQAVAFVKPRTAAQLMELAQEHSRSWGQAKDGEQLDIYIDLIPEDEYEDREARLDGLNRDLAAVFGDMQS